MRKGVNGKQKGASFEREACKKLSLWISDGVQEDVYWRSASSGGRSTIAFAKGKRLAAQCGDITCIHPIGQAFADKFHMECKAYRSLDYEGFFTGKGSLVKFWNETVADAARYKKEPVLIAKQNNQPSIICFTYTAFIHIVFAEQKLVNCPWLNLVAIPFVDFLKIGKFRCS